MKHILNYLKNLRENLPFVIHTIRTRLREAFGAVPQLEQQQLSNSWPPVLTGGSHAVGLEAEGVTTIYWGTDGLLQSPKPTNDFYVVSRFDQSPKQEVSYLENGKGVQTTRIRITHGHQWDITVRDDSRMTPPMAGDTIVVTDAGGIVPCANPARGNVFTAKVIDPSYNAAPKQPGERVLRVEALLLIEGTSGVLVPGVAV